MESNRVEVVDMKSEMDMEGERDEPKANNTEQETR